VKDRRNEEIAFKVCKKKETSMLNRQVKYKFKKAGVLDDYCGFDILCAQ
jgi:hypothetical protein